MQRYGFSAKCQRAAADFVSELAHERAATLQPGIERDADDDGKERTGGRCPPHRVERMGESLREEDRKGQTHEEDGGHVVGKGQKAAAAGGEEAAEAEVDTGQEAVADVGLKIVGSAGDDSGIGGEKGDGPLRNELEQHG